MDNKNVIIICLVIILCAVIVVTAIFVSAKDTQLSVDLSEINQGDNLTISLTDNEGNPLANKNVHITINNVTYNLTTDDSGRCQLPIVLGAGNYSLGVKFDGELLLKSSSITQPLKVLDPNSSSGASSTSSSQTSGDSDKVYNEKTHSYVDRHITGATLVSVQHLSGGYTKEIYDDGYFRLFDSKGHLVNYGFA